jgi:hypothetical protein
MEMLPRSFPILQKTSARNIADGLQNTAIATNASDNS